MPKRILDDSFLDSRSMEVLSPGAQDAFPRIILLADDFGCFEVNPRILHARGWSRRPDVTEEMVAGWIVEYAERQAQDPDTGEKLAPVLMLWTHVGRRYAYLTGWHGPHGQKRRDEYGPSNPKGSKRKTPPPPAEMLAAVMAGNVRAIDGKPPGTDRIPDGNPDDEIPSLSVPAREIAGKLPGDDRESAGKCTVPAPAVPVAVPGAAAAGEAPLLPLRPLAADTAAPARSLVAEPPAGVRRNDEGTSPPRGRDQAGEAPATPSPARASPLRTPGEALAARWDRHPRAAQLHALLAERWPRIARSPIETDIAALDERCRVRGTAPFARDCIAFADERGTDPATTTYFARCLADIAETSEPVAPRAPGELPRWGDPDFDDPAAYPDWNAYQARSAPASAVPITGPAVRRVDP